MKVACRYITRQGSNAIAKTGISHVKSIKKVITQTNRSGYVRSGTKRVIYGA